MIVYNIIIVFSSNIYHNSPIGYDTIDWESCKFDIYDVYTFFVAKKIVKLLL